MVRPNAARRLTRGSSAGPDRLETATLRRSLRDLVALSAFPAVWVGQHLPQVAASLAEVLCGAVDLDFLHVQVALGAGDTAHEVARTGERWATDREAELLRRALDSWQNLPSGSVPLFADPLSGGTVRVVAIPIGLAGDCGRLAAASRRADFPTEGERLLLGVAANQVAFVLQARQAARAAAERTQLLALSAEVGQALAQEETLRESLQRCAQALVDHLGGAFASIWTLNEAEHVLELQASAGLYRHLDGPHGRVPLGDLKIGLIAQERRPHLTNDVLNDVRMSDRAWAEREGMRAFAGYPLLIGERTVGVMAMFARVPLSETALEAMSSVANGIALGIERRRAEARLREQTEVVETINRIGQLLSAELDQEKLVQAVTDAATELTGAQFGAFFYNVIDESGESYTLYSVSGVSRDAFAHFPMPRNTAIFEPTFRGESIIRLDDVTLDPRYGRSSPYYGMPAGHLPVRSYLAVPVVSRSGEVLGGLFFGHADPGVFSERAERVIAGIAAQAAVAIDNARLYRQAQTAIQLRDEFLSVASHELRTPLTTLRAHAQFTLRRFQRDGVLDPDRAVRALEAVDERSRHLGALIEQLLDVSRLEAGGLALEPRETDLVALLGEVVAGAQARTERHAIDLQAPTELRLELDPLRIEQVLTNLLENAIKYSPEGGSIEVAMSQPSDETVEIAIRDHGIGIPPEQRDRVFERFYRAHAGHRSGVGLGLYIARQIVELHGGELRAEFPDDGGSRFIVRLSRHPAATTES